MTTGAKIPTLYFDSVANIGDVCGPTIVEKLTGNRTYLVGNLDFEHLVTIGSLLSITNENSIIWGTGLSNPADGVGTAIAENIYSLRGKNTYQTMKDAGLNLRDVPLGDPGFLMPKLLGISSLASDRQFIGIVPHYVDRSTSFFKRAMMRDDVLDLNVHDGLDKFFGDMARCSAVVSSSLHGLIFAEALQIPNIWVKASDRVLGGGFKFKDWFSIGKSPQLMPLLVDEKTNIESISRAAELHGVEIDCDELLRCFPFEWCERFN